LVSQWNVFFGFNSSLNSSILSVMLNAYVTWFTSPNHDRISVRFFGVGKSDIARRIAGDGRTLSGVISNPENSTVPDANTNFDGFWIIPFLPQVSSHRQVWKKLFSSVSDHRNAQFNTLILSSDAEYNCPKNFHTSIIGSVHLNPTRQLWQPLSAIACMVMRCELVLAIG